MGALLLFQATRLTDPARPFHGPDNGPWGLAGTDPGPDRSALASLGQGRLFLLGHRLDINLATQRELTLLPRIGPKRAEMIIKARSRGRTFRSLEDLREIPGFGPVLIRDLRPLVRFGLPAAP